MMRLISFACLALTLTGCAKQSVPSDPVAAARYYVKGWNTSSMYLPPQEEISFFANHFQEVSNVLGDALADNEETVRQRAAYVIEHIGEKASALEPRLATQIGKEQSRLVRLYLYGAIRATGAKDPATVEGLKKRYNGMINAEETKEGIYSTTDERISLASALYVIDDQPEERGKLLQEVTQWLQPPAATLSGRELDTYWEHRWMAVISVEHMRGAKEAIPLLESMLAEKPTKSWVDVHVPRALQTLRKSLDNQ
jgi:hypothetical protein